ncbi:DUF3231 family protein [Evansella cellulosilytica]|uniref:DUF3231 family protein n=1 Tax=Evansella cellulosilytica (strain ATCC 21833 / DSM 2522 / FERM P-1141 / JCM 9156 / N-4) TaxID=649639 RepID=E6TVM3_EVAC2|nr:DUF3231 family protein [Evansella cellulosilytica]ADU32151.1 hypothetical protein Bcell_3915 [Evansella cellulosilytica DSM 2522]
MDKQHSSHNEETIMHVKEHQQNKKLSAAEIGDLFTNYLGDSLFSCMFEHFLEVVEDEDVKQFITFANEVSQKHTKAIEQIYQSEGIPVPVAFGESDVRNGAPRLFSDTFMVFYTTEMSKAAMISYGNAIAAASRHDIIDYFDMCMQDSIATYKKGITLLSEKGLDITPPTIPYPKKRDFVDKESFISVITGKTRPLTALEIKHLQLNMNTNILGKALQLAFSQTTTMDELRSYFRKGAELSQETLLELEKLLVNEDLPAPKLMDAHITDATEAPFSDKLMLFHTALAIAAGIENFGIAVSNILRHDIHLQFGALSGKVAKFANEGTNLTIKYGWLEEPPTAADRDKLSSKPLH